jgi:hypothetical protein
VTAPKVRSECRRDGATGAEAECAHSLNRGMEAMHRLGQGPLKLSSIHRGCCNCLPHQVAVRTNWGGCARRVYVDAPGFRWPSAETDASSSLFRVEQVSDQVAKKTASADEIGACVQAQYNCQQLA